jgi:hypothetical protein
MRVTLVGRRLPSCPGQAAFLTADGPPVTAKTPDSRSLTARTPQARVANREVDVEFVSRGETPGFLYVKACSAFDPPTAISCDQHCLDPHFRGADETRTQAGCERAACP